MRKIIAVAALLLLGACASGPPESALNTAQNELRTARNAFLVGQVVLAGYQALPPCGSKGAGPVCYDLNVGEMAGHAMTGLKAAMDGLEAGLAAFSGGDKAIDVVALTTAVVKAAVAVSQIAAAMQKG